MGAIYSKRVSLAKDVEAEVPARVPGLSSDWGNPGDSGELDSVHWGDWDVGSDVDLGPQGPTPVVSIW